MSIPRYPEPADGRLIFIVFRYYFLVIVQHQSYRPTLCNNTTMHPPLDRPHPDCQTEINNLRHCHDTTSKLKFWGCNDVKFALDKCLKEEKLRLLEILNQDMVTKRAAEEDVFQMAMGKETSFEEYLNADKDYVKAMEERRKRDAGQ